MYKVFKFGSWSGGLKLNQTKLEEDEKKDGLTYLNWEFAAIVVGQNLKLEPLKPEKKAMWRREMNCLLSVCDYIVEFSPTAQYLEDGTIVEVNYF